MPEHRPARSGISRYYFMPLPIKLVFLFTTLTAIILFAYFLMGIPVAGLVLSGTRYTYLLFAVLGFNVFMGLGATRRQRGKAPPWFDYVLALVLAGILIYFLVNYRSIEFDEWNQPDRLRFALALVLGVLSLEAGRRVGGWGFVILLVFSIIYPNFADRFSGIFWGARVPPDEVFAAFAYGADGLRGLPGIMLGSMILGFYFFAGVMMGMSGGEFFLKLATSILGHVRGGPAKVVVLASGFFGSLSGSIVANIAGTGAFTIPAMKRLGYPPHYAGAIEGCASSGGDTMPPIMGGMVFMAAYITGEDYADIMVAAFLPTMLYYFGLLVQVDGYAAKVGLRGLPRVEIPKLLPTLASGWLYLVCLVFLVVALIYFRWGYISPIYATALMIVVTLGQGGFNLWRRRLRNQLRPEDNWRGIGTTLLRRSEEALVHTAGLINFGVAVFLAMSFILVGLFKTGTAGALTAWIVQLGAGNVYLVLFIAMIFNMLMGMVGLSRAAYLFLAVTMAPAVVQLSGVPIILVHLFIIFYAGLGGLTPPVAINAFIAASIAGAEPMKTAWMSMRLGIVLLFVPFFFVLQPALALIGSAIDILRYTALAFIGIFFLTSGLEGYLVRVGNLKPWERLMLVGGGFMIAFPVLWATLAGLGITILSIVLAVIRIRLSGGARITESALNTYVEYPEAGYE